MGKLLTGIKITAALLFTGAMLALIAFSLPLTGWKALSVQTGSMEPAIHAGSLVLVHQTTPENLQPGNVITYKKQGETATITHRIIQHTGLPDGPKQTIVKGDANQSADPPLDDTQIVGRVEITIPHLGRALDFIKTPWGLALCVYLPLLLIFISEVRLLVRRLTQLELEKQKAGKKSDKDDDDTAPPPASPTKPSNDPQPKPRPIRTISLALLGALAIAAITPTFAAQETEATLTDNIISTADLPASTSQPKLLIDRLDFPPEDTQPHGLQHWRTKQPKQVVITLYNSRPHKKPNIKGYTIHCTAGELYRFTNEKWGPRGEQFKYIEIEQASINLNGDFLTLKDSSGNIIDAISWGSNLDHLNPSIPSPQPSNHIKRIRHQDTDTAADWKLHP